MVMLLVDEVRLTRDALRYGYAVGKVRVLESRIPDRSAFERLVDAPTLAEQKRLLTETPYGRFLDNASTADQVERGLDDALEEFYAFLDAASLPSEVTAFFRTKYDFMNLKAALKARLLGAPLEGLLTAHGNVPAEQFVGDLDELPEPFGTLAEAADELGDTESIDLAVDRAMFAELLRLAKASRSRFLVSIAERIVDIANVKTLVRSRAAGRPIEATGGALFAGGSVPAARLLALAELEPAELAARLGRLPQFKGFSAAWVDEAARLDVDLDAMQAAALRAGRTAELGSEPVIAYVMAREAEVATVRTLLLGRLSGLDNETLRSRLRAAYR